MLHPSPAIGEKLEQKGGSAIRWGARSARAVLLYYLTINTITPGARGATRLPFCIDSTISPCFAFLMSFPQRGRLGHEMPSWVGDGSFYFITINCTPRGQNQLCRPDIGPAVFAAAAHNHQKCAWHCRLMLLMPDHLHAIIAFPRETGMKRTIINWKHYLATNQPIQWQRDFFDHRLQKRTGRARKN